MNTMNCCETCGKQCKNASAYKKHQERKRPCKPHQTRSSFRKTKLPAELVVAGILPADQEVLQLVVEPINQIINTTPSLRTEGGSRLRAPLADTNSERVLQGDALELLPTLADNSAQIVLADPPYNIGKDFGNDSDRQTMEQYLSWCEKWIQECLRILRPNGTMFVFGFSENLALILSKIPLNIHRRWIVWHYTNKNMASLHFWQRSHESILILWKEDKVFHRDDIREPYTDGFLKGAAGKQRAATQGRFSKGDKTTTYTAHPEGALPRDVIKIPALAGGAGKKERVDHPTQKPLALCEKLLKSCKQDPSQGFVLVPFAGSGSECLAAKLLNLPFVGIEINPDYVSLIQSRLSNISTDVLE
jgi:site-specific DNA-methyltransferase (adenine-specific)